MEIMGYEKEHSDRLRRLMPECTVLLKTNGDFPLEAPCRLALYGSGARHTVKGGTGSGEVNSRHFVNAEQGLTEAGFEITTGVWLDGYDQVRAQAKKQFVQTIKKRAKEKRVMPVMEAMGAVMPEPEYELPLEGEGSAAVYVLSRISGEGNDRQATAGDIKLSETEKRDILLLNRKYARFMLVLNVGGPVDLSEVTEVDNILVLSQLGADTGTALADILLGKGNPSGKLTASWSAWEDYCTIGQFGEINDTRYYEGVYVGYRYFDTVGKKALFPFGHGLSYTRFEIEKGAAVIDGETVTVNVAVTNTGKFTGKEVVQVYVSVPDGRLDQPYQTLAGFAKTTELAPGQRDTLSIRFAMSDLASFDELRSSYILGPGDYVVRIGACSTDTQTAALIRLDEEVIVRKVRSVGGDPGFKDWKPENKKPQENLSGLPVLKMDISAIETVAVQYDMPEEIDDAATKLSDAQLAYLGVGAFDPKGGIASIIGNASSTVAGAAGETTGLLKGQGLPVLVMADGPAGLRLSPQFYTDGKGAHTIGQGGLPESILEFLPAPVRWLARSLSGGSAKAPKGKTVKFQHCTAIPIGTAIAQSWNLELARACGDIVGAEMERFGVHLWLAPALNIHRSILCGRNFEYFSEDPLISGKFAAAITLGVQAHPGCGTTIKHFAANNQETNRYMSNSVVSGRALREIYLKGFGICIKEAQPCAVMTSYNLLNGEHTSERRDLTEDYLRSECGFQGIVMTDWIISAIPADRASIHRKPKASRISAAGSELVMPGSKKDYADIMDGLKTGALTRRQLEVNASRLMKVFRRLKLPVSK